MTEHCLDRAQVGAALQQVRCKGMPQHVRADSFGRDAGARAELTDDLIEADTAEMRLARRKQPKRISGHERRPGGDRVARPIGDRHEPFPAALSPQDQERPIGCDGTARQRNQFGRAHARAVEQFDQCLSLIHI